VIAVVALAVLWKWKVNPGWVVLGGGVAGILLTAARWCIFQTHKRSIRFLFALTPEFVIKV
jgi:hypothetical protein